MSGNGKLYGKIFIEGKIITLTGLHIGTGKETMEIGGVDMPVVRDPLTKEPYIPGSSIKGKMRSLLEKFEFAHSDKNITPGQYFSKIIKSGSEEIRHHECSDDNCPVCRLYGASKGNGIEKNRPARIYVHDAHLIEDSKKELQGIDTGLYLTELKYENTLDRLTSAASPRQIERVPKGAKFQFSIVYNQSEPKDSDLFKKDLKSIFTSILLLKDDGLGGSISRGYGRIDIQEIKIVYRDADYYIQRDKKEILIEQAENQDLKTFLFEKALEKLTK